MPYSCASCGRESLLARTLRCAQCQPTKPVDRVDALHHQLTQHTKVHPNWLLVTGSFASEEFDRLYCTWICARWDAGDPWVRECWPTRPVALRAC